MDEFIPAFPMPGGDADRYESDPGMSLRDYFAGQAVAGLAQLNMGPMFDDDGPSSEVFAKRAYQLADSMMEARKQ